MKVLNRTKGVMTKSHFEEIVTKELSDFEQVIVANVDLVQHNKELSRFDFWTSLFFCATIFTTVGYGHISPKTGIGRAATLCYAIFGIPLCLMVLFDLGKVLKGGFRFLWTFVIRLLRCPNVGAHKLDQEDEEDDEAEIDFNLPPLVAILVLLLYIFLGSFIYIQWERWRLLTAFYFIFITFSAGTLLHSQVLALSSTLHFWHSPPLSSAGTLLHSQVLALSSTLKCWHSPPLSSAGTLLHSQVLATLLHSPVLALSSTLQY
ncbi:hypothetical protein NP493_924g00009 [Ridgeia piscesae]|uniref:Potassium channel domain-containing protein n=1 Tax=Ridgeia piscesae TaxID=27915 RepID=A0AAD9KK28_RIDPI|nr:hypothetical protein NP493_924g00009 [Ridgeia piscesae]